jgi:Tol biopolymer transport system component
MCGVIMTLALNLGPVLHAVATVVVACGLTSCVWADSERFGIFISTLDGRNVQRIVSDAHREINHARVSPDWQWITFTRYNKRGLTGVAKEEGGYMETEIMLARIDGSDMQSLVPPHQDKVAANGYWSEDGKAILYVTNDNPARRAQINRIDLRTRTISKVALDNDLWAADPHPVGGRMAISVFDPKESMSSIWLTTDSVGKVRRISFPRSSGPVQGTTPLGDYDPKISPEGDKVVAMRNLGNHNWHVILIDLKSGQERDLSAAKAVDGVPEWSGDGGKLIFWHVDVNDLGKSGLYTMNADGSGRWRIPLPKGYFYTMPAFFPQEGSHSGARIIFSAQKSPVL